MGIYDTYSKRKQQRERAGQPDVYNYDDLPQPLRVQIIYIWSDAIGQHMSSTQFGEEWHPPVSNMLWAEIHATMCRELGELHLTAKGLRPFEDCTYFIQQTSHVDHALDIIEISFRIIDHKVRRLDKRVREASNIRQDPDDAITELNHRFREHGIGYQYVEGQIIRVDSHYVHAEVVKPAISLLKHAGFQGPSEEFLSAHKHYREGRNKEAISDALKAFESTMKAICAAMKWTVPENATAKPLIDACFANGLIPSSLTGQFSSLRATLESGLPTIRNKMGGHGQGQKPVEVPDHVAAYALHLAATNIVFLVESFLKLRK